MILKAALHVNITFEIDLYHNLFIHKITYIDMQFCLSNSQTNNNNYIALFFTQTTFYCDQTTFSLQYSLIGKTLPFQIFILIHTGLLLKN